MAMIVQNYVFICSLKISQFVIKGEKNQLKTNFGQPNVPTKFVSEGAVFLPSSHLATELEVKISMKSSS